MVNIIKESSSFVIQGDVNSYPFKDGKISLPLNSLYFVIDESNVISFKQVNDNNTLLSVNINNLQINGEEVTKENLIEKFDAVANGSMGGTKINAGTNITLQPQEDGSITISATGELGGTVAWADVTDKPSTFTPSAHTHLSADITDLQGKLDAKQNTLVSGTNIKTINGESILGEGNIVIEGGTGDVTQQYVDEQLALKVDKTAYEADKATFALKTEIPSIEGLASKEELQNGLDGKQDKGDYALKSELPDISGLATKEELAAKQDTLVSGTNIKTVNGQTLLGEGNIEIQGGGSGISDAPSDNKLYGRKNANWSEIIIPSTDNFATKSEIADMLTKTEASEKYQPKGEYLTEVPSEYVTETELSSKGYLTAIPEEYVTNEELTSALSSKQDKGDYATKAELNLKANTSDLSNYLQTSVAESTYAKKSEIPEEYTLPIATAEVLGGIKVGSGLSINPGTGVLSATGGGTADSVDWANITSKPDDIVNITDKLAEKLDVSTYNSEKATFATKEELADKANTSDLSNYLTTTDAQSNYAKKSEIPSLEGYLQTSVADEKYATKTELSSKADASAIADMLTKTEAASTYQPKGEYATTSQLSGKQDTLVSGESIKTINGQTLLGEGDITIEGGSGISDAPSDGKLYGRKNANWSEISKENDVYNNSMLWADNLSKNQIALVNEIEEGAYTIDESYDAYIYVDVMGIGKRLCRLYNSDTLTKTEASTTYKTIASEWYGTQSEYDLIAEKDPNVTYYITEG